MVWYNSGMGKRYEVNVARQGWHLFATDSRIRSYHAVIVADMICEFQAAFPDCTVSVTCFDGSVEEVVQAALDGTIDRFRLAKAVGKFRSGVMNQRSNDYVGEAAADE